MSCKEVLQCLAEARNFSAPEETHLEACSHCRSMVGTFNEPAAPLPEVRLQAIARRFSRSLKPVRALPSDRTLLSIGLLLFIAFCLLASYVVGFYGFKSLSLSQLLTYYSALTGLAFLFSMLTVQEMIPGSRRLVQPLPMIALLLALIVALPFALFHDASLTRFVPLGIPCLRLGCLCALISGGLASIFIRKGFSISPLHTGVGAGLFVGLAGFSVLALHCPIQNAAHVTVWHGGAVLAGGIGGAIVGLIRERIS